MRIKKSCRRENVSGGPLPCASYPLTDIKTRLVEVEVVACVLAAAIAAFLLMVGYSLWLSLARKW